MTAGQLAVVTAASDVHAGDSLAVTTCQRVERYSLDGCTCDSPQQLAGFEALLHLSEVAAGLHSVVLGEDEVLGQVRTAIREAPAPLAALVELAVASARQLRREAGFDSHSGHLLDRALKLASAEPGGALLIIGTGKMSKLIASRAAILGFERIIVAGRREPESGWITASGFTYVPLGDIRSLDDVDVAVGCLGSSAGELDVARDLPPVHRLLLDLGTPRNFAGTDGLPVLTIAQLLDSQYDHHHSEQRRHALTLRLREILEQRVAAGGRTSSSTVGALRFQVEQVRRRELERISRLHPDIAPETLDAITRSLVNQIFHLPSRRLTENDDPELTDQVVALFTASEPAAPPASRPVVKDEVAVS